MNDETASLHHRAIEAADRAALAKLSGNREEFQSFTREALDLEVAAARLLVDRLDMEPSRSVLHRSAASLALEAGQPRMAEQLISTALAGSPPEDIAEELRDLLEDVNFQRHLAVRGIKLESNEFQMSMEGEGVGFGVAPIENFVGRVRDVEKLIYRTAERRLGREFRESGRRRKGLAEEVELYISVPRAASFAVTFRIGRSDQLRLPGLDFAGSVLDDLMDCIELFDRAKIAELTEKVNDESYLRNFIGLATKIAPDGERVRMVGFTASSPTGERAVVLSTPREGLRDRLPSTAPTEGLPEGQLVEVRGVLLEADATSQREGKIEVISVDGKRQRLAVPRGMMSDVVKPCFEESVVIQASRRGPHLILQSIELAEADDGRN